MLKSAELSIRNFTKTRVLRVLYHKAWKLILPTWDISLVFVLPKDAKRLNKSLRGKTYTPNVLSYQVGPRSGEVIICPSVASKQAPLYQLSTTNYQLFLFIHGLFHLEGMRHGHTMEKSERAALARILGTRLKNGPTPHQHRH